MTPEPEPERFQPSVGLGPNPENAAIARDEDPFSMPVNISGMCVWWCVCSTRCKANKSIWLRGGCVVWCGVRYLVEGVACSTCGCCTFPATLVPHSRAHIERD